MSEFIFEYFMFVFLAALGTIQVAASASGLRGILIFKHPLVGRGFGTALTFASLVCFFSTGERNINDYVGGIDANGQALYAFLGCFAAAVTTVIGTSAINFRMSHSGPAPYLGFEALRETTFLKALWANLNYWSKEWQTLTKKYFFG